MAPRVGQGGTIRLSAVYIDGAGNNVNPTNPRVDILNPSNVALVTDAVPTQDALGEFHYDYAVDVAAPQGVWTAHWTGIVNTVSVGDDDAFEVVSPGEIEFPPLDHDPLVVTWRPSLAEVAAYVHTRTKTASGDYLDTFTEDTRPNDQQVERLITMATGRVASRVNNVGNLCKESLTSNARSLAGLFAAMLIEQSYFPEQVENNHSPYPQLKQLYDDGMSELTEAVAEICGGPGGGSVVGGTERGPYYGFGTSTRPLGRESVW